MRRMIIVLLVGAIVLDIAYWAIWFTERDLVASEHSHAYHEFENAFPLADLWLGVACLLALVGLLRGWPSTLFWLIAAGASAVYLGCMDLLYDLQNDIFGKGSGGVVEAFIVAVTFAFAIIVLRYAWSHRGELLADESAHPADAG